MSADASVETRYRGPSAVGQDLRRFWSLAFTLAATDFKLRFFGSALGYLWSLVRPLLLFGVLYVVFTEVIRFGAGVDHYPVYLLSGLVLFQFFSETTSKGVTSLVDRENLLRKIHFPRLVVPLAVALHAVFNLGLNLIVVFVFVFASGIEPRVEWLEILVLLPLLAAFAAGVSMLLSALYVRFRDSEPIWEVGLQLLFYGSPVLYVITEVPDSFEEIAAMNPIAVVITQWRHAVIDPDAPTIVDVIGGWDAMLIPLAIVAATFAIGAWVFARETPRIAENL